MSSEDKIRELLQDAIASQEEITQNFSNDMSLSWPDQSMEMTFEGNFNNSYNQDWRMHQDFSMSYDETDGFEKPTSSCQPMFKSFEKEKKELIKMCEDVMNIDRDLISKMDKMKEEKARLQEKIEETSREKEEMWEEFEKMLQLTRKEFEGKEALQIEKVNMLQELNKKLIFEVKTLRVDKGILLKKNGEVSDKNKELELQIERLEVEKNSASKEFEDLAKLLELTKKKELDHLAELAKAKQEIEAKLTKAIQLPKEEKLNISQGDSSAEVKKPNTNKARRKSKNPPPPHPTKTHQQGIIPNPITVCHHCDKICHIRPKGQEYETRGTRENFKYRENYRHVRKVWVEKSRSRKSPPRIRKIWVRKDRLDQAKNISKDKMVKSSTLVWVVKSGEFPNLVKPPLVDNIPSTCA